MQVGSQPKMPLFCARNVHPGRLGAAWPVSSALRGNIAQAAGVENAINAVKDATLSKVCAFCVYMCMFLQSHLTRVFFSTMCILTHHMHLHTGKSACLLCDAGKQADSERTACFDCDPGFFSNSDSDGCEVRERVCVHVCWLVYVVVIDCVYFGVQSK
jgi:hypothetical protein